MLSRPLRLVEHSVLWCCWRRQAGSGEGGMAFCWRVIGHHPCSATPSFRSDLMVAFSHIAPPPCTPSPCDLLALVIHGDRSTVLIVLPEGALEV